MAEMPRVGREVAMVLRVECEVTVVSRLKCEVAAVLRVDCCLVGGGWVAFPFFRFGMILYHAQTAIFMDETISDMRIYLACL